MDGEIKMKKYFPNNGKFPGRKANAGYLELTEIF
jgi:hypothetical protein